jgi:hypothetical protein
MSLTTAWIVCCVVFVFVFAYNLGLVMGRRANENPR